MDPDEILDTVREDAPGAADRLRRRLLGGAVAAGIALAIGKVLTRIRNLWATSLDGAYSLGQTFNQADPWLQWQLGRTEKHCKDCLHLNGQIHRASEWQAAGIQPQSGDLECGGWNCDCRLVEVAGYEGQGEGVIV